MSRAACVVHHAWVACGWEEGKVLLKTSQWSMRLKMPTEKGLARTVTRAYSRDGYNGMEAPITSGRLNFCAIAKPCVCACVRVRSRVCVCGCELNH